MLPVVQLEDDSRSPLQSSEQKVALTLGQLNHWQDRALQAELLLGQLATVACSLIKMVQEKREIVVIGETVVIPNEVSRRVEGAQVQAMETQDGVGVTLIERSPLEIVHG